jgi:aminopeptidase N
MLPFVLRAIAVAALFGEAAVPPACPEGTTETLDGKEGLFESAGGGRGPHSYDVHHYDLSIELFPDIEELAVETGITLEARGMPLDTVPLDLLALSVDSAWDASGPLGFQQGDTLVDVALSAPLAPGDTLTIWLTCQGHPTAPGFLWDRPFGEHSTHYSVGMSQYSGRYIFPCWDDIYDKATFQTAVTVPDGLYAVSCGELTDVRRNADGTGTYVWSMPREMALYVWAIAASDFIVVEDSTYSWIRYYAFEDHLDEIGPVYGKVDRMLDCFEGLFCPWPWDQCLGFPFLNTAGFYEHNTIPFTHTLNESIVAHEVAHHWWGNFVTEESWPEIWLAEGFATYSQALWEEYEYGEEAYSECMLTMMQQYLYSNQVFPIVPAKLYWSATTYKKGASVLHMLRYILGDVDFFAGLQLYLAGNAYGSVTTEDLVEAFEAATDRELSWFFEQWVYGAGYPDYDVSWTADGIAQGWEVTVALEQVQGVGPVFEMPVELRVAGVGADTTVVMWNDAQSQSETWTVGFQPMDVVLDPDHHILRAGLETGVGEGGQPVRPAAVTVRPNPASTSTTVTWAGHDSFLVTVYDLAGRRLERYRITPKSPAMDLRGLAPGRYCLLLQEGGLVDAAALTVLDGHGN